LGAGRLVSLERRIDRHTLRAFPLVDRHGTRQLGQVVPEALVFERRCTWLDGYDTAAGLHKRGLVRLRILSVVLAIDHRITVPVRDRFREGERPLRCRYDIVDLLAIGV
jgi:hypothetical protein